MLEIIELLLARAIYGTAELALVPANAKLIAATVTGLVGPLGTTAIYLELRRVKEGGTLDEIASVFE